MAEIFLCSLCHEEHPVEERTIFGNRELCQNCLAAETVLCDRCGDRIWLADACCDDTTTLCQHCAETYYSRCADCGRLVEHGNLRYLPDDDSDDEDEDEDGYCEQCYARRVSPRSIQNYSYKPEPIFYGSANRHFGVELEIDGAGENGENANLIKAVANRYADHLYIKHDGSLNAGLELVTHPMTLEYHRNNMPWVEVLRKALRLGYTSHQTDTCGLHIHVNRSSLGDFWDEQENVIARILFLVETFWHELLRFSRRTQSQMDKWASRYGRRDDPKDVLHNAKNRCDRYTCVNLTPRSTIEFRMFRGTLKYNTLIATLQLVERLCDVAISLSDSKIKSVTWSSFVTEIDPEAMPELIQYLKERRLYVNEPIAAEPEV